MDIMHKKYVIKIWILYYFLIGVMDFLWIKGVYKMGLICIKFICIKYKKYTLNDMNKTCIIFMNIFVKYTQKCEFYTSFIHSIACWEPIRRCYFQKIFPCAGLGGAV